MIREIKALLGASLFVGQILVWVLLSNIPIVRFMPLIVLAPMTGLSYIFLISASTPPGKNA